MLWSGLFKIGQGGSIEEDIKYRLLNIRLHLSLEKDVTLRLKNNLEFSSHKDALCKAWFDGQVVLEKKMQREKLTDRRTDNGQTDDGRQAIRGAHFCFQLR